MINDADVPAWMKRATRPSDGPPRIVIVGPCASGKTTLSAALLAAGFEALACAQEHSEVPYLWALCEPDAVVYLAATLDTIRQRRATPTWSSAIHLRQLRRLDVALAHCTVYIDTDRRDAPTVLRVAHAGLCAAGVWQLKDRAVR